MLLSLTARSGAVRGRGAAYSVAQGLRAQPSEGPKGYCSPPQPGTCPQRQEVEPRAPGEKHFSQTPLMDLLLFAKRVYLGVHRRCAAARCAYNRGKQEPSVAEAAPQIGPCFRGGGESCELHSVHRREALESFLIVACCQMRLTLSSVQATLPLIHSHLSRQPVPLAFLSVLAFDAAPVRQNKPATFLSSGGSAP